MNIAKATVLVLITVFASVGFTADAIFKLEDPRGDDYGDGTIIYPTVSDLRAGDLDLVSLSARAEKDGTEFEAVFATGIKDPGAKVIDEGGQPLSQIARHGFYTFNIDIYIDTDRKPASGFTDTLPGRNVVIGPDFAWEKMILLTPRPNEAKNLLARRLREISEDKIEKEKGRIDPEDETSVRSQVALDLEGRYFFPNRIRVSNRSVRFFVPNSFLRGPAQKDWAYVVFVTAATYEERLDLGSFGGARRKSGLFNLPVEDGAWSDRLGTSRKQAGFLPPILDLIVPVGDKQEEVLRNFDVAQKRLVTLPGVVPGE